MIKKLAVTFFGSGYLPVAPGTWGSLGAALVFLVLAATPLKQSPSSLWAVTAILAVVAAAVGIACGRWAVAHFASDDPKPFVLDEVAGQWLALILVPFATMHGLLLVVLVQFIFFRAFDVVKPAPARQAESLPHGWGIVTDDLVAGIYANIVGQLVFRVLVPAILK